MSHLAHAPQRLASIEALRGAAALAVVAFHAAGTDVFLAPGQSFPALAMLTLPASFGFSGVFLFFVISGFCIHFAAARQKAAGGPDTVAFLPFWKRRLWRLYPTYWVALCLFVACNWAEGSLSPGARPFLWDLLLHGLMLHNLDPATVLTLNSVFWTLAVEEQLYLAYFLLLFLRRRLGWFRALALCLGARLAWFGLAFALHRLWGITIPVREAALAQWFPWALGAWGVEMAFGLTKRPAWVTRLSLAAGCLTLAAALDLVSRSARPGSLLQELIWLINDPLWGFGFFVLISHAVWQESSRPPNWFSGEGVRGRVFNALRQAGLISYSLYLTHELILRHLATAIAPWLPQAASEVTLVRVFILAPLALAFAWPFYWLFERPFARRRNTTPALPAVN